MQTNVESATLDSANDAVTIELLNNTDVVFELVFGTLSGSTVTFEALGPSGAWTALGMTPSTGAAVATTATAALGDGIPCTPGSSGMIAWVTIDNEACPVGPLSVYSVDPKITSLPAGQYVCSFAIGSGAS